MNQTLVSDLNDMFVGHDVDDLVPILVSFVILMARMKGISDEEIIAFFVESVRCSEDHFKIPEGVTYQ